MKSINKEVINNLLDYNPLTGVFRWIKRNGNIAGYITSHGYICITINRSQYYAHRLAWIYCYGDCKGFEIDHINGNRRDNRIENLRLVTKELNQRNRAKNKNNKSGFTGVFWCKGIEKFRVRIKVNGKENHIGYFDCIDKALEERDKFYEKNDFHVNHGTVKNE